MIPVVLGILLDAGRVLVQERPFPKPYAGFWEFPGGKIERNESGLQALQREWKEEVALEIKHAELALVNTHTYPDRVVHMEIWRILDYQGEVKPQEAQRVLWATDSDLDGLQILAGNASIVQWVKQFLV